MWFPSSLTQVKKHLPEPVGGILPNTAEDGAAFGTRAHCQLMFSLGTLSSFQHSVSPQPAAGYVVIVPQVQDLAFPFVKPHRIPVSQFVQVPLYGSTILCYIQHLPAASSALY